VALGCLNLRADLERSALQVLSVEIPTIARLEAATAGDGPLRRCAEDIVGDYAPRELPEGGYLLVPVRSSP
jgi:hypothetical protein